MNNPWLDIPYSDYENHMEDIGQTKVLNDLVKYYLQKNKPESFALLGCSTGNGLEHVDTNITKTIFALDLNPEYLKILKSRFEYFGERLNIIQSDIQNESMPFENAEMIFAGLVLEYVNVNDALIKMVRSLNKKGSLIIIIQKSKNRKDFVTKTEYTSLKKLDVFSGEVNMNEIIDFLYDLQLYLAESKEIFLTREKSFICMEFSFRI